MNTEWSEAQAQALAQVLLRDWRQFAVVFYDPELRITGWSEGAHAITGWTASDMLGASTARLFTVGDREKALHLHEANTARVVGVAEDERWHLRKDGSCFWSSGVSLALRGAGGETTGYVKVFRDLTNLRTRLRYLENLVEAAEAQKNEKNVFIGTIAHEMRNPLAPLKTAVELIRAVPEDAERRANALKLIERQVGFLDRLVEDLVDLTRVHSGKMSLTYEQGVLQELLLEAVHHCRDAADSKGLQLHVVMPPVPIAVEIDTRRFLQVLFNLLNNAIKFTASGGNIWLTATVDESWFVCSVKDDGVGIRADLLPRIFDIFTQADQRHSQRGAGLGIGLAVVKEIVSLMHGNVEVRSKGDGGGSEFILRIPLLQTRPAPASPFALG
ncbi:PAS domain-containing sensor histidine kinase [Duganella callida]|uniref:histidine kinase n=1 Tax=Duganella callida TaxID=2561932 RepID=A0A4Y9SCB2_9BURK|nr:PAS domain-containing sensor histidine kinase [Duganella callida]TFW19965.1 PAS domain-containing sensor histidine kinase [Duganella callida]